MLNVIVRSAIVNIYFLSKIENRYVFPISNFLIRIYNVSYNDV